MSRSGREQNHTRGNDGTRPRRGSVLPRGSRRRAIARGLAASFARARDTDRTPPRYFRPSSLGEVRVRGVEGNLLSSNFSSHWRRSFRANRLLPSNISSSAMKHWRIVSVVWERGTAARGTEGGRVVVSPAEGRPGARQALLLEENGSIWVNDPEGIHLELRPSQEWSSEVCTYIVAPSPSSAEHGVCSWLGSRGIVVEDGSPREPLWVLSSSHSDSYTRESISESPNDSDSALLDLFPKDSEKPLAVFLPKL